MSAVAFWLGSLKNDLTQFSINPNGDGNGEEKEEVLAQCLFTTSNTFFSFSQYLNAGYIVKIGDISFQSCLPRFFPTGIYMYCFFIGW